MGLELQSRGFIYLRGNDKIETDFEEFPYSKWWETGSHNQFRHFCANAKTSAYAGANHVAQHLDELSQSLGFFSLSADYCDVGPGYDRAYLLADGFQELNARSSHEPDAVPQAIFNHFSLCRFIQLDTMSAELFLKKENLPLYDSEYDGLLPIAGWFNNHAPVAGFESLARNFSDSRSITFGSSGYLDQYLFFGDTADTSSTITSMCACSAQFKTTVGVVFLIHETFFEQLFFFNGKAYALGNVTPNELDFSPRPPIQYWE